MRHDPKPRTRFQAPVMARGTGTVGVRIGVRIGVRVRVADSKTDADSDKDSGDLGLMTSVVFMTARCDVDADADVEADAVDNKLQ